MRRRVKTTFEHGRYWHDSHQRGHWHWDCECGGHSLGGDIEFDAEYKAQQHQWRKGAGHPEPRVYREGCP